MNVASQHSLYSLGSAVSFICKSAYLWPILLLCIVKKTHTTFIFKAQLGLMQAGELTAGRLYTQFTNWNSSSGSAFNCFGRHFRSRRYSGAGGHSHMYLFIFSLGRCLHTSITHNTIHSIVIWCHKYPDNTEMGGVTLSLSWTTQPFTADEAFRVRKGLMFVNWRCSVFLRSWVQLDQVREDF